MSASASVRASMTAKTSSFKCMTGERIDLRVSTFVTSIYDIQAAQNCFSCDFTLSLSWDDPKVVEAKIPNHSYITLGSGSLDPNLRPDVFLINDKASENDKSLVAEEIYVADAKRGTVINNRRMRGTFTHNFDLHPFPFDKHKFTVQFYFHPCYKLVGPIPSIKTEWWGQQANNEFDIANDIEDSFFTERSKGSGITFERYEFEIRVARKFTSYLINVGLVVEGLFFLGLAVLMFPTKDLSSRINLALVIVLTYSAFKMMVASMVPALGYMTILDIWIMTGFCFGILAGVASMGIVYFNLDDGTASMLNRTVAWVSIGGWALLHMILLKRSRVWKRRSFLECNRDAVRKALITE